jgi:signal transduction histidine kinase
MNRPGGILPRWFSARRGLILQLFLVMVFPLAVLLVAITLGSVALHQQAMRTLVGERDQRAVRAAASAIAGQVRQRTNAVRLVARQAQHADPAELPGILSADFLQADFDYGLAYLGSDGALEATSGDPQIWNTLLLALLPEVRSLFENENAPPVLVSDAYTDPQTGARLVLVMAADPDRQRVAAGAFSVRALAQHILDDGVADGHPTAFLLVDNQHQPIYRLGTLFTEEQLHNHAGISEVMGGESGTTIQRVGGSEHVVAYSPVDALGWGLVSEEHWELVDTSMLRTTQLAPLVLAPVLALALAALWFAARQIIRPLQELENRSARLAWGDFQAIEEPVGGISEIRRLQAGLVHMAHKVEASQQSLHHYIGAITAAQEDERRRLARELHDDTIQALIALKQRVGLAEMGLPAASDWRASLDEITSLTDQTIENLRRLTRALRPIYLEDLGLVTALEMLARETGQAAGIPVAFQCQGEQRRLEPGVELALYRIAQESLSNVARHARASRAALEMLFTDQAVTLEIRDDGQGFITPASPAEFAPSGHYGLLGMHERAELVGARLELDSSPGKGTRLKIIFNN